MSKNDDIVTRLRVELPCWCDAEPTRIEIRDMCWEASAEIEYLRAEVYKWKKLAEERNPHSWRSLVSKRYGLEDMYER